MCSGIFLLDEHLQYFTYEIHLVARFDDLDFATLVTGAFRIILG